MHFEFLKKQFKTCVLSEVNRFQSPNFVGTSTSWYFCNYKYLQNGNYMIQQLLNVKSFQFKPKPIGQYNGYSLV
jgi:hypothetical protein